MKVFTGGSFDLFHAGHVEFLKQCHKISGYDQVIVSLNTDEFIERYKGSKPIVSYEDRKKVLMSCRSVRDVIPNMDGEDSKPAILSVNPDFIVVGDDWATRDYYKQMNFTQKWLNEKNIVLCYVPYTQGISSTEIKKRLINQ